MNQSAYVAMLKEKNPGLCVDVSTLSLTSASFLHQIKKAFEAGRQHRSEELAAADALRKAAESDIPKNPFEALFGGFGKR